MNTSDITLRRNSTEVIVASVHDNFAFIYNTDIDKNGGCTTKHIYLRYNEIEQLYHNMIAAKLASEEL